MNLLIMLVGMMLHEGRPEANDAENEIADHGCAMSHRKAERLR
ncbi:hypothetical protein RYA05_03620 [Pseudomonas syringae pv. actinidiae]|nr:hypothetical protein [Pseudomonas syringae pv. actinidiae]